MKSRKIFLLLSSTSIFCLLFVTSLSAQSLKNRAGTIFQQAKVRLDNNQHVPLEVRFQDDQKISLSPFFEQYRRAFAWSDDNEAISFKQLYDDLGQTHHRYKQYYKGIELAEVQYLVHEADGSVTYAHGKLIHGLDLDVTPELSEAQALQRALSHIGANKYMWENRKSEAFLKKIQNNREATYFPVGKLKISSGLMPKVVENFKLVYRFDIYAESPVSRNYVDVDAKSGEIVGVIPRLYSDDVEGTGTTLYNGDVDIIVSDKNIDDPNNYPVYSHVSDWNAYGGSGTSWWMADTSIGSAGGYSDYWYQVLDTDPVNLYGEQVSLSFRHRFAAESPSPPDQMPEGYDGWDGMNVRISIDDGDSWQVLENPTPIYSNESLFSFGNTQGEGEGIPGWAGENESWTEVNFDISAYKGYTVMIRFAFASDPAVSTELDGNLDWFGWQLDDIVIKNLGDTLFSNTGQAEGMTGKNNLFLPGNYRLREIGRGGGIETYDLQNQETVWLAIDIVDEDYNFTDLNTRAGVSVHWAAEASYDYYLSEHGRNSFDDDGGKILSYVHLGVDVFNAYWNGAFMQFGDGDASNGYRPLVGIDIVGHELTHGVTQYSADLIYQDEFGALNESFSDIFGEHIESYATDGGHDWLIGDDSGVIRSFTNPNAYTQPDTYFGDLWYDGAEDYGGVHINSGVQNFWFYLLSVGGSGVNDFGEAYSIEAIGMEDAAKIAYRNLTVYLMPTSEYEDARLGSINAAIDLFGATSSHVLAVVEAWNAVGVYYPFVGPYPENPSINGNYFIPGSDTLFVQSTIINLNEHELEVKTIIESLDQTLTDTIFMHDDGMHRDNLANDGVWGGSWPVPSGERNYSLSTMSTSVDSGFSNILRDALYFTTKGPVTVESVEITSADSVINPGDFLIFEFLISNYGNTDTVYNISSKTVALDECTEVVAFSDPEYGDIAPGESSSGSRGIRIRFNDCPAPAELSFVQEIYSDDNLFWSDTFTVDIITAINDLKNTLPGHFSLNQNYPNPFNPSTVISYQLPITSDVELSVYNLLGQKVATLFTGNQKAGSHRVEWNASGFSSGIYYYTLRTNSGFVQTRKLVLIR